MELYVLLYLLNELLNLLRIVSCKIHGPLSHSGFTLKFKPSNQTNDLIG